MLTYHITDNNVCVPYKLILGRIHAFYRQTGARPVADPARADLIIMGCCGAFHRMEKAALVQLKALRQNTGAELVAFGCLVRIAPEKIKALFPDRMIASPDWRELAALVPANGHDLATTTFPNDFLSAREYRRFDPRRKFLLIQTGCSSACPHCPHKLGIGDLESLPLEEILDQAAACVQAGARELVVHGNDTGAYGTDRDGPFFPDLIEGLLALPVDLYLSQINADWAYHYRREFLELIRNPKIKELQILIQSTSARLLRLMGRQPVVRRLESILARAHALRPDILYRTDLIVGYPESTAEEDRRSARFAARYFDEIAVHGFEIFANVPIKGMDLHFHSQRVIAARTAGVLSMLGRERDKIIHQGGQDYGRLTDIEPYKEALRAQKRALAPLT